MSSQGIGSLMVRARFGSVRLLPSGRFQARFVDPSGLRRTAPETYRTEADAWRYLDRVHKEIRRGYWQADDGGGKRTLRECCEAYLEENPRVGARWAETCRRNMRLHLTELRDLPIIAITPPVVRGWHARALRGAGGRTSISQSYRLLRSVLQVAVNDGVILRNPCQIPGAGTQRSPERGIATPEQVAALVEAVTPRYRAPVVLAAWCGLRRGEVCALWTEDVDLSARVVHVRKNWVELLESPVKFEKEPKSEAGKRTLKLPPPVVPLLAEHEKTFAGPDFFCVAASGHRMSGNAVYQALVRARNRVGVDISFHDLRHTGQSLVAAAGASLADLKKRLGHSSSAAAQRYLHTVEGRDSQIAVALSELARAGDAAALPRRLS